MLKLAKGTISTFLLTFCLTIKNLNSAYLEYLGYLAGMCKNGPEKSHKALFSMTLAALI